MAILYNNNFKCEYIRQRDIIRRSKEVRNRAKMAVTSDSYKCGGMRPTNVTESTPLKAFTGHTWAHRQKHKALAKVTTKN